MFLFNSAFEGVSRRLPFSVLVVAFSKFAHCGSESGESSVIERIRSCEVKLSQLTLVGPSRVSVCAALVEQSHCKPISHGFGIPGVQFFRDNKVNPQSSGIRRSKRQNLAELTHSYFQVPRVT